MKNATLFAGAILATLALALPASAAHITRAYWAESYAEQTLLNSAWAQDNGLEDAQCIGRGRAAYATDGTAQYLNFFCTLYYENDYNGGLASFTAQMRVIADPDRFTLANLSDPSFGQPATSASGASLASSASSTAGGGPATPATAVNQRSSGLTTLPLIGDAGNHFTASGGEVVTRFDLNSECVYADSNGSCYDQAGQPTGYTIRFTHP